MNILKIKYVTFQTSGMAFTGLRGLELYPMLSSTAAKSLMRVTYSCSVPASLQMDCLSVLRPLHRAYLTSMFPGLNYLSQSVFADILKKPHGMLFFLETLFS